jgi:pterin-4a-carbinolamine dehydratase
MPPSSCIGRQRSSKSSNTTRGGVGWSNELRLVTVGLTTWDAKNRITARDLEVAEGLDALYLDFQRSRGAGQIAR